ncbi:MAG: class I SAM-dependent methyltransferase [Steroidobacteraceae bacterium]
MNTGAAAIPEAPALKQCCASLYESEAAKWLLGESFHPGGLALTARLGCELGLAAGDRLLDVASGQGTSALYLAERFGCEVVGIDYGETNVASARAVAAARGLSDRVAFRRGDAESMPFEDGTFDALVCECAYCTFPDKPRAAREFARVLRPGGRIGLADLTRTARLAQELEGLIAWVACIADAQLPERYVEDLRAAGLVIGTIEARPEALRELVQQVRGRLLAAEVLQGLKKLAISGIDFAAVRSMARLAAEAIESGSLGYALITGAKP